MAGCSIPIFCGPRCVMGDDIHISRRTHETNSETMDWDWSYGGICADHGGHVHGAVSYRSCRIHLRTAGFNGGWRGRQTGSVSQGQMLERRRNGLTTPAHGLMVARRVAVSSSPRVQPTSSVRLTSWPPRYTLSSMSPSPQTGRRVGMVHPPVPLSSPGGCDRGLSIPHPWALIVGQI